MKVIHKRNDLFFAGMMVWNITFVMLLGQAGKHGDHIDYHNVDVDIDNDRD